MVDIDVHTLKQYLIDNDKVEYLLESLGMHSVNYNTSGYWTCGMPDGDNKMSTTVYKSEMLNVVAYTRNIIQGKRKSSDIIDLIQFIEKCNFPKAKKYICDIVGIDYYEDEEESLPLSLQILKEIEDMNSGMETEEHIKTRVIDEDILGYYSTNCNRWFYEDGISYEIQKKYEIGYDDCTNRITIPIRNELGDLIGVKGRSVIPCDDKYIYLEKCNKSHILYGLYQAYNEILYQGIVFVAEAEKSVLQGATQGIHHIVALGGHVISKYQLNLLQRLNVKVCLMFDKDIGLEDILNECSKFEDFVDVYYIQDTNNLLTDKQSPTDNSEAFKELREKYMFKYIR